MDEIRVLIGTPLKGEVSPHYAKVLAELSAGELAGYRFEHAFMGGTCIFGARDILAHRAMEEGYQKLIFWDADLKPIAADFVRLVSHPEPFVCGAYGKRQVEGQWHFFPVPGAEILPNGLWEMQQSAIGFSVLDVPMLKQIKERNPQSTYRNKEAGENVRQYHQFFPWQIIGENTAREKLERLKEFMNGKLNHAFNAGETLMKISEIVDGDDYSANLMQGEDYGFCRLAREAGFKIWLDSKLVIPHTGHCDFPIPNEELIRMTTEPWRQEYWAKLRAKLRAERAEKPVSA